MLGVVIAHSSISIVGHFIILLCTMHILNYITKILLFVVVTMSSGAAILSGKTWLITNMGKSNVLLH